MEGGRQERKKGMKEGKVKKMNKGCEGMTVQHRGERCEKGKCKNR